jgi:PIN domain nuclease of toxin-antitoxin system
MIVADTHAWLWWLSGSDELSRDACDAIDRGLEDGALGVSAISVWEAAMLVKKGRLQLALSMADLVAHCEQLTGLSFLPITPRIALASVALEPLHADPADRLVAATALSHRAVLVSRDDRLRRLSGLASLW